MGNNFAHGMFQTNGPQAVYIVQGERLGTVSKRANNLWCWARLRSAHLPGWDAPKSGTVASKVEALLLSSGEKIETTKVSKSDEY